MKAVRTRLAAVTFAAFGLLAIVGCKGGAAAGGKYIPEAANVVGGIDLAGIQSTKLWTDHLKGMVESKGKDQLDAMAACNLGLDKWKSVTIGASNDFDNDKMALVVVADGIGKKENLECAFTKMKEKEGTDPWTVKEDGKVLEMAKDGTVAYVVDDNTLAVAGKAWASDVQKLTKGEGKSVFDGEMKDLIGRADRGKQVWFAGKLPDAVGAMAKEQLGATPKDVAGYVDFSSGIAMQASVGVGTKEEAESVKTKVEALFALVKDQAKSAGASEGTINSVKFGTDGAALTVEAKANDDDVKASMEKLKPFMGS